VEDLTVEPYTASYTRFTKGKEFKEDALTFAAPHIFQWFLDLEKVFLACCATISGVKNAIHKLSKLAKSVVQSPDFKNCHNIGEKLMTRFFSFR